MYIFVSFSVGSHFISPPEGISLAAGAWQHLLCFNMQMRAWADLYSFIMATLCAIWALTGYLSFGINKLIRPQHKLLWFHFVVKHFFFHIQIASVTVRTNDALLSVAVSVFSYKKCFTGASCKAQQPVCLFLDIWRSFMIRKSHMVSIIIIIDRLKKLTINSDNSWTGFTFQHTYVAPTQTKYLFNLIINYPNRIITWKISNESNLLLKDNHDVNI